MPTQILATARTPWTRRHGPLAASHPEDLLEAVLRVALERAGVEWKDVGLVLVACESPVGAQASTLGRRVLDRLGAETTATASIEASHVGDLLALELAMTRPTVTVVAAVESTSIVAPGAALVRDYGRPTSLGPPELEWLEQAAHDAGLDRDALDAEAELLGRPAATPPAVTAVPVGNRSSVAEDLGPEPEPVDGLLPLRAPDGLLTAAHHAGLADGAAALVLGPGPGRALTEIVVRAHERTETLQQAIELATDSTPTIVADAWVIASAAARRRGAKLLGAAEGVRSVLAAGSVPSADGLRVLVDGCAAVEDSFRVVRRGRGGQLVIVDVGAAR